MLTLKANPIDAERAANPVDLLVMQKYYLQSVVYYSASTTVDAESYEEAKAIAEQREVRTMDSGPLETEGEVWIVHDLSSYDVDDINAA